ELERLTSLQTLDLFGCSILSDDLSPLAGLTSLQSLNLAMGIELSGDLSPLADLISLQEQAQGAKAPAVCACLARAEAAKRGGKRAGWRPTLSARGRYPCCPPPRDRRSPYRSAGDGLARVTGSAPSARDDLYR